LKKPTLIDPDVSQRLGQLPRNERADCLLALHELQDGFGQPHLHAGLAIRKLRTTTFECRGNLKLRFLFENRPECLYVFALVSRDEVRRLLRSGRIA
jgi:hypothetical protein